MGLFLSVAGVIGAESAQVKDALAEYARAGGGAFEVVEGTTDDPDIGVVTRKGVNTTVVHPSGLDGWDSVARYVSERLGVPVFAFHIHDGDMWMYILYDKGREIDQFNPYPEYWGEMDDKEKERWSGNAKTIASVVPSITADAVSRYLVEWEPAAENQEKAYPEDSCCRGDCWQMCDFMKKVGLQYPMADDGSVLGDTFRTWTKEVPGPQEGHKKAWWHLW